MKYLGFSFIILLACNIQSQTTLKRKCKDGEYLSHTIDNVYLPNKKINVIEARVIDFVKECQFLVEARKVSDHLPVSLSFELH